MTYVDFTLRTLSFTRQGMVTISKKKKTSKKKGRKKLGKLLSSMPQLVPKPLLAFIIFFLNTHSRLVSHLASISVHFIPFLVSHPRYQQFWCLRSGIACTSYGLHLDLFSIFFCNRCCLVSCDVQNKDLNAGCPQRTIQLPLLQIYLYPLFQSCIFQAPYCPSKKAMCYYKTSKYPYILINFILIYVYILISYHFFLQLG